MPKTTLEDAGDLRFPGQGSLEFVVPAKFLLAGILDNRLQSRTSKRK